MSTSFKHILELTEDQIDQYRHAVVNAFPQIVRSSQVIANHWASVEKYFSEYQLFLINDHEDVVAFINSIPFYWDRNLDLLPREGWDWMLIKGVEDFEKNILPNSLGGLQIIVAKDYLGQGYSKVILDKAKEVVRRMGFDNFVIPIRPTFKSRHPNMAMSDYIEYQEDGRIYDPWIRTHLKGGAQILKICDRAMHVYGDINFWENIMKNPIEATGNYIVDGALNPVYMDVDKDYGEYYEDNLWISYPTSI